VGFLGTILGTVGTVVTGNPAFLTAGASYDASKNAKNAASGAADAQVKAAQLGIDEQRRQFDAIQALLKPYVTAGTGALTGQQDLLGLNGQQAQATAINGIAASPQFAALKQQGEESILANASATGGLRGGNVQGALAQFSPALLSQLIDQQYSRLGGLSAQGQNAAAGVGNAGMNTANNVTNLYGAQGAATAGSLLAAGRADNGLISSITKGFGSMGGGGGLGGFSFGDLFNGRGLGGGL
jgi:hypothetical protein